MPENYTTVKRSGYAEYEEKRSLFIGQAIRTVSEDEALAFIKSQKAKYHDARHNVSAYLLASGVVRCSDDGEPQGSAGVPVLDCIRKSGVTDVCIVVTRYFGGILLGVGGLLRAYTKAAAEAIADAGIVTYEEYTEFSLTCSYSDYQRIVFEFEKCGAIVDRVDYTDSVCLRFAAKSEIADTLCGSIFEITAGRSRAVVTGKRFDGC